MTKVIVYGSKGRLGQALLACAPNFPNIQIVGQVDLGDSLEAVIGQADVVVDFSSPKATLGLVKCCVAAGKAMVIGTTGHTLEVRAEIRREAGPIAVVWASNFSPGVNVLFHLTHSAAELLGPDFDLEVMEMHHRLKKDAPSGTAKTLAEILAGVRDQQFAGEETYPRQKVKKAYTSQGRRGDTGGRDCNEICVHSLRGGDVAGDHTVYFAGDGERLELTHRASSPRVFANGALRAAQWVHKQVPGLYSMGHVLGLV
mgnify:CR=1 FL=1